MDLLGGLGIDFKLLLAQIVNFALLLWVLDKFLYKSLIKRIEKDESEMVEAQNLKAKLEKLQAEIEDQKKYDALLLKKKSRVIIKEAEEIAKKIKSKAQKEAEEEKKQVITQIKAKLAEVEK